MLTASSSNRLAILADGLRYFVAGCRGITLTGISRKGFTLAAPALAAMLAGLRLPLLCFRLLDSKVRVDPAAMGVDRKWGARLRSGFVEFAGYRVLRLLALTRQISDSKRPDAPLETTRRDLPQRTA